MRKARPQPRSVRSPLILGLAGLILGLLLVEGILRLAGFSYRLYPETIEFGWPDPERMRSDYAPDDDLLWVTKNYEEKLESAIRNHPTIVFMGCSCTEFSRYDRHFAGRVASRYPQTRATFVNLGVGGWSSYNGLQQMKRDIVRIHPEIVTIFYGWNDHWIGFGIEDKDVARVTRSILPRLQNLRVVQFATMATMAIAQRENADLPERVSPADFEHNLTEMVRIAGSHDIIPVLLTAPTSLQQGHEPVYLRERWIRELEDVVPLHQAYVSIVRRVAEREQVVLCDLAAAFDALPDDVVTTRYFHEDGIHPTDEGAEKIAEFMFACFDEAGLLEIFAP